jgi:type I restriction enzyme, S subunit
MEKTIKEKYKQTEVGLIPSDWEVKTLNDISTSIASGKSKTISQDGGAFPILGSTGIIGHSSNYDYQGIKILVARVGANAGTVNSIDGSYCVSDNTLMISLKSDYDFSFNLFFLKYSNLNKLVFGSGQPLITGSQLKQLSIPLPPTKAEQTAIATALSDADALISGLEKLIAKKRNIKQGAMQKLLQPKEGWEVKPFKDLCWFQEGPGLRNWQFTTRGIKVINVTNLENGILNLDRTERHISLEEFHKMYEHFEIDENDIVVASSGNSYGKVAVVRKQDLPLVMNTSVIRFKPFKELDYNFLLTYLKSNQFKKQIDLLITGGAQPNFGPVHLNKISINVPPTKEEQTRIATVLLDMDNEMLALETKLEKYKKVKLGMMQELLTGEIRLIVNC